MTASIKWQMKLQHMFASARVCSYANHVFKAAHRSTQLLHVKATELAQEK